MKKPVFYFLFILISASFTHAETIHVDIKNGTPLSALYIVPSDKFSGDWGKTLLKNGIHDPFETVFKFPHDMYVYTLSFDFEPEKKYHIKMNDEFGTEGIVENMVLSEVQHIIFMYYQADNKYFCRNHGYRAEDPKIVYNSDGDNLKALHSPEEIIARHDQIKDFYFDGNFEEEPIDEAIFKPGKLSERQKQSGSKTVNFIRFLAGVDDNIQLDENLNDLSQHAAILYSAGINPEDNIEFELFMSEDFYKKAKLGYANTIKARLCSGSIYRVLIQLAYDVRNCTVNQSGNRRKLLSPYLNKMGIGQCDNYTTLYISDLDKTKKFPLPAICWPAPGYFPTEFFGIGHLWSCTLDPEKFKTPDPEKVKVIISRINDKKSWTLDNSMSAEDDYSGYLKVSNKAALDNTILFRPPVEINEENKYYYNYYVNYSIYTVKITGLQDLKGKSAELKYTVRFFSLGDW